MNRDAITGCLLGTAVGDAIGLPYEAVSRSRALRLLGQPDRHRLLAGHGLVSDDTEQSCMVAQALLASGSDPEHFRSEMGRRLRRWLLGLPAGIGMATLRAAVRLWFGVPADSSGVYSAGNGPAMRAAILGAAIDDLDLLLELVQANTRLTHTDPKALSGALAVALAAWHARKEAPPLATTYLELLRQKLEPDDVLLPLLEAAADSSGRGESPASFADSLGLEEGVGGYVLQTVPVAVQAWLRYPEDLRRAVTETVACGGDADTMAAIVGGIVGSRVGRNGVPQDWLDGLCEWPRTVAWMERLAALLAANLDRPEPTVPPRLPALPLLLRNVLFLLLVLAHGFRRLLPPY